MGEGGPVGDDIPGDPELLGVFGIERVFGVDECRDAAGPLSVGNSMQRECGLAA